MIGIQLKGDSDFYELLATASIQLKIENPLLGDAEKLSPGSYSFPFELPIGDVSPKNSMMLKNPDVIANSAPYSIKPADLFFDHVHLKTGNLKYRSVDQKTASAYFTFGFTTINPAIKKARLRQVMYWLFQIGNTPITKKVYLQKVGPGDISLTLNGTTYTAPNTIIGRGDLNLATSGDAFNKTLDKDYAWAPKVFVRSGSTPGGITGDYLEIKLVQDYTISPLVFGERDATDPLLELYVTTEDDFADYLVEVDMGTYYSEFETFFNNYIDGSYPDETIRFPVLFNSKLYGSEQIKQGEGINLTGSSGLVLNDPNWGFDNTQPFITKSSNSLQPFVLVKGILDRIAQVFGFTWEGDFYNDCGSMLLWNSEALDVPQNFLGADKFIFWKREFNANELVPDITVMEFLNNLRARYNLAIYQDERTGKVKISYREVLAKSNEYEEITRISSPVKTQQPDRIEGYTLIVNKDTTDDYSEAETLSIGDTSEETIEIKCGRLFKLASALVEDEAVSGPRVSQELGAKGMMRIFHYKGLIPNNGYSYPAADITTADFPEVLGVLHDEFHKYYLLFRKNRVFIHLDVRYSLGQLLRYDFSKKRRVDGSNYWVKAIDLTLKNSGQFLITLELMTMRS